MIEAGSIIGVTIGVGGDIFEKADKERPLYVIVRGGESMKVVGVSCSDILLSATEARKVLKARPDLDFFHLAADGAKVVRDGE